MSAFYAEGPLEPGTAITLAGGTAHHAHVRRLAIGDVVGLTNGAGVLARGKVTRMSRGAVDVAIDEAREVPRPPPLVLLAPVGDRDRMLWLAEKATELGVTEWRPVAYHRSRSVTPRGEGESFAGRVRGRMIAALEQSGGAWLPAILPDEDVAPASEREGPGARLVLHPAGPPLDPREAAAGVTLAVGPEGGFEPDEYRRFVAGGWRPAAIAATILRFETAAVAAVAIIRAAQLPTTGRTDG